MGARSYRSRFPKKPNTPCFMRFRKRAYYGSCPEATVSSSSSNQPDKAALGRYPQVAVAALEYGTARHVESVVISVDGTKKRFLVKQWTACKNDSEVSAWIDKATLSKANRAKLLTWTAHVQQWHQALTAHEQARLDNLVAEWGIPIRDIAKLMASSLLKILRCYSLDYRNAWKRQAQVGQSSWRCGVTSRLTSSSSACILNRCLSVQRSWM